MRPLLSISGALLCAGSLTACVTSRALAPLPSAGLHAKNADGKVTARVKRVQLKWGDYSDQGPDQLVIEIKNASKRELRLIPKQIRLLQLRKQDPKADEVALAKTDPAIPKLNAAEGVVAGGIAGAKLGGSLSGGSGGGGGALAGGVGGALLGGAAMVAIAIPMGIYILADRVARERERDIDPGETRSLRISLGKVQLDDGKHYALDLSSALEPSEPMEPLMVVNSDDEWHQGYGPPSSLRWTWALRLGGGAILEGPTTGGLGGAELFVGRQWRRFSLGAFAMLGLGSVGLEARYRLEVARWLNLIPFASYGYTFGAGRFGWAVGHGPRAGLEIGFPIAQKMRMGYRARLMTLGLYGHAGPLFIHDRDGVGLKMQFGLVFGVF